MKPDRLEEFIKTNRDAFDNLEPSPGVWESIKKDSAKIKKLKRNPVLWRAAAVAAVVVITASILFTTFINQPDYVVLSDDPQMQELIEAESYYAREVNTRLKEIRKCYTVLPGLKEEIETDLNELEQMYFQLKTDLKENVSNKEVIEAMIENNRYRLKLVDDVLEQINC